MHGNTKHQCGNDSVIKAGEFQLANTGETIQFNGRRYAVKTSSDYSLSAIDVERTLGVKPVADGRIGLKIYYNVDLGTQH